MDLLTLILCSLIATGTFLLWEFVAWFSHKYVMHGFLWRWHKSHHTVHGHVLERNDLFALVFSLPCIGLFYYASQVVYNPYLLAVATGIFCYGLFYLVFHDILVHQRIRWRPEKRSKYLQRIIHAHYIHHSKHSREGCEAFGFLIAPKKYEPENFTYKQERQETQ
ncbi:beta-carotene 3-hydroxylase [Chryseolinea serpens]|uniref:Beta-carotene 3-hydroxylase n=2 Tax=Chryseolinea serpens TaxID=947013 RepID=A0A1M5VFE1_9BACT|nr:beta-carotene 3-hydroxylase [Chryseolinea serpens]